MKKKYIVPTLDVIKAQMISVICGLSSGGNTPVSDPQPGEEVPGAAPKLKVV